ncbi:protein ecdysoneless [Echria macrotheca]|uniref:Protein ecdysoneless n=1 Tax=Echria macrotheca TaxID=438768 RepID=A0AAJ0B884_9PEZI|nr:protein ecdysoneless [Echria macrotheca]
MESSSEPRPGDVDFEGFRMRLPEDSVEYMIFIVGDKSLGKLETVRRAAIDKANELTKDYIWQRDAFNLETKIQNGLSYLHGVTNFGDNVEDEWLIVYLLRELSKSFPEIWVRVFDSDGEFLLIEAAKVLPKWLSPENDENRVWIHKGELRIIPLQTTDATQSKTISLGDALGIISSRPDTLIHSTFIEAEAFYRLEKYPAQITESLHHALVTIPRKLAYILHVRPKAIAPATEAFYLRDPLSLRPLLSPSGVLTFPPDDLVTVSVRFTRVLYAQLKSQNFDPPPAWSGFLRFAESEALSGDEEATRKLAQLDLGMKVTTGFEILARNAHEHNNRVAREVAILLEDLEEDGESALPSDEEIKSWKESSREDDDSWMDIDYRDFEKELDGKKRGGDRGEGASAPGFGNANAQADLQKIVSRFEAFLNDENAGIDGAELDEMDVDDDDDDDDEEEDQSSEDEDRDVSFDEEQFANMMRDMMGLPAANQGGRQTNDEKEAPAARHRRQDKDATTTTVENPGDREDNENEEIRKLMNQMESELSGLGALQLDPPPAATSKPAIKATTAGKSSSSAAETGGGEDDGGEVSIDYNLAKNILESFKSQGGMAGPAGNLLNLMGMTLPRDEGDSDEEE